MTLLEFGSQFTGGSTVSSDTMSGSVGSVQPRVRSVRLVRPSCGGVLPAPGITARHGPTLGFSLRGGREHGTGFFVSSVEPGTEAHRQGLKVGDQLIRINGFTVDDAVHKEVLQLISNHTHLNLKVRSVGMIPIKDRNSDCLSWQITTADSTSSTRSSPQLTDKIQDVRVNILVAPRTKLGCGICKGPEWKSGIFVQFTKEGGIAREAGLRPGDQILYCNNIDFTDIQFNEAVNIMKTARQLDLMVRKGAGAELFPSESSGYNSSASSVTGDQSPSWSDSKRLSIVKEESLELEDRLSQLGRKKTSPVWEKNGSEWDDCEDYYQFKPTIINLSENGTTISNNGSEEECQDIFDVVNTADANTLTRNGTYSNGLNGQQDAKTVRVEVHRNDQSFETTKTETGTKGPFANRGSDSCSLSSAISLELQRRSERNNKTPPEGAETKPSIDEQLQKQKILKGVSTDKHQQHSKLMDEFKKVHRRMFKTIDEDCTLPKVNESLSIPKTFPDRELAAERPKFERRSPETLQEPKTTTPPTRQLPISSASLGPPPPPPPPHQHQQRDTTTPEKQQQNGTLKPSKSSKAAPPPVPVKYSTLSYKRDPRPIADYLSRPPPCPTPDYDNLSIGSNSTLSRTFAKNGKASQPPRTQDIHENGAVEMDSLDSFKLNNSSSNNLPRRPPSTYFSNGGLVTSKSAGAPNNGSVTSNSSSIFGNSAKKQRPVSVVIGQYPSNTLRRQPGKLEFLNGSSGSDESDKASSPGDSISSRFASELAYTLNRSNLRKRTESMENIFDSPQIRPQKNGSVTISLNNTLSRNFAKSTNNLSSLYEDAKSNRVTINIPSPLSSGDKKSDMPSGILKNGNGNHNFHNSHKPLVHQKSITFGEMPTVINDQLLPVK